MECVHITRAYVRNKYQTLTLYKTKKKTWDLFCDITTDSGKYLGHLDFLCLNLAIIRVGVKG